MTKVFCIGFHKTGTTSLELALKKLGYRVTGSFGTKDPDIVEKVHELVEKGEKLCQAVMRIANGMILSPNTPDGSPH